MKIVWFILYNLTGLGHSSVIPHFTHFEVRTSTAQKEPNFEMYESSVATMARIREFPPGEVRRSSMTVWKAYEHEIRYGSDGTVRLVRK